MVSLDDLKMEPDAVFEECQELLNISTLSGVPIWFELLIPSLNGLENSEDLHRESHILDWFYHGLSPDQLVLHYTYDL